MVTFNFKDYGENLGTRPLGRQVRERLLPLLEQNERVVLDFTGVDVVSNSFADVDDAHDAVTRRLCLERGDGDAFAHQEVHQR
ncbi:MAG: STAS-like domain-containing protein [Bacteroidales bacterium]|nr:STAS-like domain-containing protein [Bacteroidales bacterium]